MTGPNREANAAAFLDAARAAPAKLTVQAGPTT
jgi:hypothetical protein